MVGAGLSGLVARCVDALFGQEDVVLRLAAGLDGPGILAEGWRVRREGARVTIRRGVTPWDRLWRAGLFGWWAFEYRLEGRLDEGAVLRGRTSLDLPVFAGIGIGVYLDVFGYLGTSASTRDPGASLIAGAQLTFDRLFKLAVE